jgi:hypothetical protein
MAPLDHPGVRRTRVPLPQEHSLYQRAVIVPGFVRTVYHNTFRMPPR